MQNISQSSTAQLDEPPPPEHRHGHDRATTLPDFIEQHWTDYTAEQHDVWEFSTSGA